MRHIVPIEGLPTTPGITPCKSYNKVIPKRKWIEDIVNECHKNKTPVFMKSSLENVWNGKLIQEFPTELRKDH